MDSQLYGDRSIFVSTPQYKNELKALIPSGSHDIWRQYQVALSNFRRSVELYILARNASNDQMAQLAYGSVGEARTGLSNASINLKNWIANCNKRINETARNL